MSGLTSRIRNWIEHERERTYLNGLTQRELSDLGLSQSDAVMLSRSSTDVRDRMTAMARHHGVDPDAIDAQRGMAVDVARACSQCGSLGECERYLAGGGGNPKVFCPNSATFQSMAGGEA